MRPQNLRSHDGFSLAELLVTIAVVGIAFASLLGGLMTSITASSLQRKQATADALARSAAEWVKDSIRNPYQQCATSGTYSFSDLSVPSGYSVSIPAGGVENWDPVGTVTAPYSPQFQTSQPGCADNGLQLITIIATSSDSQASETVQIVKRNVS
jgi:prepilin-type N-terminal cleavage/methylation domain-containing protein